MRTLLTALPLALATLVGCAVAPNGDPNAGGSGDGMADAEASTTATAVVVVERTVTGESVRAETVARFIRMRSGAVDDDALRMVGAATDFPAVGSCMQLAGAAGHASSGASSNALSAPVRAVALIDVGAITIESSGQKTLLSPRQLPDVADVVSGVVYTARPGDAALPARSSYILHAAGGTDLDVPAFTAMTLAPAEPTEIRVGGQDVRTSNGVALGTIAPFSPVEISWEAGSSDDSVYIDVSGSALSGSANGTGSVVPSVVTVPTTRCLFADVGKATLAANILGVIDDGTITVHRLHREAIHARGVDPGEMRFDFARVVAVSRR